MEGIRIGRKTVITHRSFGAYVIYEHGISKYRNESAELVFLTKFEVFG